MNTTSPAQIEANRRNAQLSTGPQTPEGKAASSLNALKSGILSRQLVVRGRHFQESPEEFQSFWNEYHQHLSPIGPLEEMLVDQIVAINWRLRRVRTAESGQIALSVDIGCRHRARQVDLDESPAAQDLAYYDEMMKDWLFDLRKKIDQGGELTEADLTILGDNDDKAHPDILNRLQILLEQISDNSFGLDPATLRERNQQKSLQTFDEELKKLSERISTRRNQREFKEQAHRNADLIPEAGVVEKILRYETAMERQLFRAMEQLERLQTRRLGDKVSPEPVTPPSTLV